MMILFKGYYGLNKLIQRFKNKRNADKLLFHLQNKTLSFFKKYPDGKRKRYCRARQYPS